MENFVPGSLQVIAVRGIPPVTGGDDVAAVIAPSLNVALWPDGHTGLRGEDIVIVAGKIVAKAQGRFHREGAEPDGFRTRAGIPDRLGLKAPEHPDRMAGEIRKGLAARFGGRPGVIISASESMHAGERGVRDVAIGTAGIDLATEGGESVADALAALAGIAFAKNPNCPVVAVRGLPDVMTWED